MLSPLKIPLLLVVLSLTALGKENEVLTQSVEPPTSGVLSAETPFTWSIDLKGTSDELMYRDPIGGFFPWRQSFWNSISLSIENQGESDIQSPWITTEGQPNTFSLPLLLKSILPPDASESEKAWAIYDFTRTHVFHDSEGTSDNADPIKLYNVYGYGICGDSATALSTMWTGAGLRVRAGRPLGHSTTEVQVDGVFRLFDGDLHTWVLQSDNQTFAGEEDIVRDPYLLKRTHTYGLKLWAWDPQRDAFAAGLYWYRGDRLHIHQGTAKHTMAMTLRPHEKITWLWKERFAPLPDFTPRIPGNGAMRDIADKRFHGVWEYSWKAPDSTEQTLPFRLPYPIVGCKIKGLHASNTVSVSTDGKTFLPLDNALLDTGIHEKALVETLGRTLSEPPVYTLTFKISGPPTPLHFLLDFQVAPLSLPTVHLGENRFIYTDHSQNRKVRITYRWTENHENHPPATPEPESPKPGEISSGDPIVFSWKTPADPDGDAISDYQFQLSASADPFRPLSPNFDALLSFTPDRDTTQFTLPHPGLLNGGSTYYWRVRARDAKDCWGPWGGPWPVTIAGPATPQPAAPIVDTSHRSLLLKWKGDGTKYRVFGSFHRGFIPHDKPHQMLIAKGGGEPDAFKEEPSNFLCETHATELRIPFDGDESKNLRPFYRIQAIDNQGVPGAWSEQIEIPGPILLSPNPMCLAPGQTSVTLDFLGSKGHLVNLSNNYHEQIVHPDTWLITSAESDISLHIDNQTLSFDRPLEVGEKILCRLQVRGSGYFNRERKGEITLTLIGGGKGPFIPQKKTVFPSKISGPLLFSEATLQEQKPWEITLQNAHLSMETEPDGTYLVASADQIDKSWSAMLAAKLPESFLLNENQNILWEASLKPDTFSWQAGYELTLQFHEQHRVTIVIKSWLPVQIRDSDGSSAIGKDPFSPIYGKPSRLRILFQTQTGDICIRIDDKDVCQLSGKSPLSLASDATLRIQILSREPTHGTLAIGNIQIQPTSETFATSP